MFEISNEELKELSIYELRHLARDTGVKSPTSKLKEELIKQIIEIREGRRSPVVEKSRKGRPPKTYTFNINRQKSQNLTFCQELQRYEYLDGTTVAGYVEITESGIQLCVENHLYNTYIINEELSNLYNLRNGDKLLVELDVDNGIVKDIYSVNGLAVDSVDTRMDFYEIDHCPTDQEIGFVNKMGDLRANFGDNIYLYGNNNINNTKMLINALNNVENCKKIYINLSLIEKTKGLINQLENCEKFLANITDTFEYSRRIIMLAVNHAKRLFENGENVIVAVDDVLSVSAVDNGEMSQTKELLSIAKHAENLASISVLALMTKDERLLWAEKLVDKRFVIDNEDFMTLR